MITMDKRFSLEDFKALKQITGEDARLKELSFQARVADVDVAKYDCLRAMEKLNKAETALFEQVSKMFPESVITEAKLTIAVPEA